MGQSREPDRGQRRRCLENKGGKGHAWDEILAGSTYVLADIKGAGTIDRMWMTIDDRSPEVLRSLKLQMYWDGAKRPAVSVPLGDFFLHGSGEIVPMETALFASAEGPLVQLLRADAIPSRRAHRAGQ